MLWQRPQGRVDRAQYAVGNPRRALADSSHERGIAARVDLDHLRPGWDRDSIMRQPAQDAAELARGSPRNGKAAPPVMTRPSCSQLVSTTTSVVSPATKF